MPYIFIPLISLAVVFASLIGVYNFVPISAFEPLTLNTSNNLIVGTAPTTINGSDTLSASRTVINTNFTTLYLEKVEVSTTTLPNLTTLLNLSSVGTITTGTWNATAIGVSKGGTGTTTPTQYMVLLGNGTAGLTHASSTGTAGQFLTSNGAGAYPSWQTSAVSTAIGYSWTGFHNFQGGLMASSSNSNLIASTTMFTLNVGVINSTSTPNITHNEGVRAYRSTALNLGSGYVLLAWDAETYDLAGEHSGGTFTAAKTGYYVVSVKLRHNNSQQTPIDLVLYKNDQGVATTTYNYDTPGANYAVDMSLSDVIQLNAGETISAYASTSLVHAVVPGSGYSYMTVFRR